MNNEHRHAHHPQDPAGDADPRKPRAAADPSSAARIRIDPFEFEELIRMVCAVPAGEVDPKVLELLHTTARHTPELSLRLALTALRLDRGLREAQERIIRLQWELAQCKRHAARTDRRDEMKY